MDNNNWHDKINDKVQDLKQEYRETKEQIGSKARELKNDLKEKKDQFVDKVKGSNNCTNSSSNSQKSYGNSDNWKQENTDDKKEDWKQSNSSYDTPNPGTENNQQ